MSRLARGSVCSSIFAEPADATGEVIVYQDGVEAFHLTDIVTDDTNWGEWYVGNLATNLVPAGSTVYVDDVEISEIR